MSKLFADATSDGLEESTDRVGGGPQLFQSGIYEARVEMAYAGSSPKSGAKNVTFILDLKEGDKFRDYRETIYYTSGTEKGGKNFYVDKDGKKQPLPGFTLVDDICLVTTEAYLSDQDTEEKIVKVYNPETKEEEPKGVPCLVDLIGKELLVAVLQRSAPQTQKGDDGKYHAVGPDPLSGETPMRNTNTLEKAIHAETRKTVVEIRKKHDANYIVDWAEKNTGKVIVEKSRDTGSSKPLPVAGGASNAAPKKGSLFS